MNINQAFGKALKEVRLKQGITQEGLAEAASRVYVSMLERGLKSPTLSTVEKIAQELGVDPSAILLLTCKYRSDMDDKRFSEMLKMS